MVVDVSPGTMPTSFGSTSATTASIRPSGTTSPHGTSTVVTSAPQRWAISTSRWPKRPKQGTTTRSPGASTDTSTASTPARAVPSIRSVASLAVRNTERYSSDASAMVWVMNGSNWPTSGAAIAWRTRGSALMGPGPMSSRSGGAMGPRSVTTPRSGTARCRPSAARSAAGW